MATTKAPPAPRAAPRGAAPSSPPKKPVDALPSEEHDTHTGGDADARKMLSPSASSGSGLPSVGGGAGDYASSFASAISGIVSIAAWLLEQLINIAKALFRLALGALMMLVRLPGRIIRGIRRARAFSTRRKIKSRLKQARKARKAADKALETVRERAASSVKDANVARDRAVQAAQQARGVHFLSVAAQGNRAVRAAETKRDQRVSEARRRGDRVIAQARRTGNSRIRAAEWKKADVVRAAEKKSHNIVQAAEAKRDQLIREAKAKKGDNEKAVDAARQTGNKAVQSARRKGAALRRRAVKEGNAAVRAAEAERTQRVRNARDTVDGAVDKAQRAGEREVRVAELSRAQNLVQAGKLGNDLVQKAQADGEQYVQNADSRAKQAVVDAEAAHTQYNAQIDYRVADLQDLAANNRLLPGREKRERLRAEGKEASQQRLEFNRNIDAAIDSTQPPQAAPVNTGNQADQGNQANQASQAPPGQVVNAPHTGLHNGPGRRLRAALGRGRGRTPAATTQNRTRQPKQAVAKTP